MEYYLVRKYDLDKAIDMLDEGYAMWVDLYTLQDVYEDSYCLTDFRVVRVESNKVDTSWSAVGITVASIYDIYLEG